MKKLTATVCNVSCVFYRAQMKKVMVMACSVSRVLQGTDEESDGDGV